MMLSFGGGFMMMIKSKRLRMDVGPVGKLSSGPCYWQRPLFS